MQKGLNPRREYFSLLAFESSYAEFLQVNYELIHAKDLIHAQKW